MPNNTPNNDTTSKPPMMSERSRSGESALSGPGVLDDSFSEIDSSDAGFPSLWASGPSRRWQTVILGPVLVVATLWILMSVGTTIYLRWIEAEYDRVFTENLASIRASNQLESIVWRTISEWTNPSFDADRLVDRQRQNAEQMKQMLEQVRRTAHTDEERQGQAQLETAIAEICSAMETEGAISRTTQMRSPESQQRLFDFATEVASHAEKVRTINDGLIQQSRERMATTQSIVMLTRMLLLLLGPLIGVLLGWRVARRLKSSVAQIAVTLSGSGLPVGGIGTPDLTVEITRESSFEDVRRQAERVVDRLRSVAQELQSARQEVIQSERLAAVGELAAGVAHELRNPLTSVKLLLQHAARQSESFQLPPARLQLILAEVARMESTIQGLLDFARTPTMNRVHHDLRDTVQRSLNLIDGRLRQGNVSLNTSVCSDNLMIEGDAEQLNQVFVNLLLNSIEAMPDGGELHVTARRGGPSTAEIVVSDTGSGISHEMMARLFEPFSTTKDRGTGLGLAISHRIITEHDGQIHAASEPSCGTTFTVSLPLAMSGAPAKQNRAITSLGTS